jgi:outer membrane protein OmpA-like peptidoglycan-associated protein
MGADAKLALAAAAAIAATGPAARADGIGIAVFEPTPATAGTGFQLQAPEVGEDGSWAASTILSYASNPLVLEARDAQGAIISRDSLVERSSLLQLGAAYAFLGRFEAGAHIPLYTQSGQAVGDPHMGFTRPPASGTARGNLTLHAKARLWRGGGLAAGAGAVVVIPTATKDQFTGSDKLAARLLLLGSFTPAALGSRLAISANVGAVVRGTSQYANITQQSGVAWGVGVSYRVLDPLWVTTEVFGEATPSGRRELTAGTTMPATAVLSPVEWLAGINYKVASRLTVGIAAGRGVTDGLGTPDLRGVLSLAFVQGAPALAPIHPPEPPKPDGDADGDGIPDSIDKCPDEPEDKDMFDDADGCPDPDNDHDGIPDAQDKCPLDPEDKDGFQDADGCPDKDNDADGIPDAQDKCPNEPEDKDGFQDLDGCPDPDNDNDGIPDAQDKCPSEPETINGIQDDDGCPDKGDSTIILSPDRIETLDPIRFNGLKLTKTSTPLLEQVAATLRAHGEIIRLRITVHVQPTNDADADQAKSDKRAQAVREWLVQWGIAPARVEARGFGGTKPLVPADQRGAAKINDRLELIILERK